MTRDDGGVEFKGEYAEFHECREQHSLAAAIINYILSHRRQAHIRKKIFKWMDEVERTQHSSSSSYYRCIRQRFTDGLIIKKFARALRAGEDGPSWYSALVVRARAAIPSLTGRVFSMVCCGLECSISLSKAGVRARSKLAIISSNIFFWTHFIIVLFNLGDMVKDITFTAAVKHFDTNIVQDYQDSSVSRYQQYYDFNVHYVFLTSVGLLLSSQLVTYVYWSMIRDKPRFLMSCQHQSTVSRALQVLIQYIPCTLPILLFAQDTSVKIALGEQADAVLDPAGFADHLVLLSEQRLVEKISLNIKIIEVVCEAYGQLIVQSVVLLRLKTLIQTDYFNYFGISFEYIIMISMVLSVLSIFTTFWSYHTRSKQRFRRLLSTSTFLQLVTWILLITTKLFVYVISFINFPGLFFVPVLVQFCVTATVLTFTGVSPSFRASAWHDRLIHCMVCCVLPLAVSDDPQWQLQDITMDRFSVPGSEPGSPQDQDGGSLQSFGSVTRMLRKNKKLSRANTVTNQKEFEKKSRNEMMLALFLYTFECLSVTAFSAIMYQFYHFEKYREFLRHFVTQYFSFLPEDVSGFYGVIVLMVGVVATVVLLSSCLIVTYYRKLHPRLNMFTVYRRGKESLVGDTLNLALTPQHGPPVQPELAGQVNQAVSEYFV